MRGAHYTRTRGPRSMQPIDPCSGALVPAFFARPREVGAAGPRASDRRATAPAPQHTPPVRTCSRAAVSGCATRQQMVMSFSMIVKVLVVKKLVGQ